MWAWGGTDGWAWGSASGRNIRAGQKKGRGFFWRRELSQEGRRRLEVTRVNSANVLDEGLRIGEEGVR
jgi:hypothetical protein